MQTSRNELIQEIFTLKKQNRAYQEQQPDCSQFLEIQKDLRKSKEYADLLFLMVPSAIFIVNTNKIITGWNRKCEEITGYSAKEAIGQTCAIVCLQSDNCRLFSPTIEKPIIGRECSLLTKAGTIRNAKKSADLLLDDNGEIIGGIECFEDITEQKSMLDKLFNEKSKLKSILQATGQGMHIVNKDYTIEFQNNILKNLFSDTLGQRCYFVYKQRTTPCDVCRMQIALQTDKQQTTELTMVNNRCYTQRYAPFVDTDKEKKCLILLQDITEEKIYQAETMRTSQLASLGELSAGVAHEINNPINGIINYAQLLLDDSQDQPDSQNMLGRITKEGERIANIVSKLLAFSRQNNDNDEPIREVDLATVLEDSFVLLKHQFLNDHIIYKVHFQEPILPVMAIHQQLQQVFINLLSNAKYALNKKFPTLDNEKRLDITCSKVEHNGTPFVRILFQDQGCGIPPEIIKLACNPFFSTKEPGAGTGLGLSISRSIITSFGGFLFIESEEGKFTKIKVDLPTMHLSQHN
ncbi:MAG: ATP-binding protein [Desulfobulbaceae bacterium]|jgi:two-component system NtrC family sensor kinase|nr:ATP-binding protein [Desulfobulbaceae bacterium]